MSGEKIVTVFGSSRSEAGEPDYEEARALGAALAHRGFAVCTGGYRGAMEAASRGAKEAGGKTYGVTAEFFGKKANAWLDVEIRKKTWDQRLFTLIEMGDGFVACKGGTGTLVELAVVWEMLNKSVLTDKPIMVLGNFWRPVLDRVREVEQGPKNQSASRVWGEANAELVQVVGTVEEAAKHLGNKLRNGMATGR